VNSRDESATPPAEQASPPPFDLVLRGYHKGQVDQHLAAVQDEMRTLRQQRDSLKRELDAATARTTELNAQLGRLQQRLESDATTPPLASDPAVAAEPYSPPGPIADKLVRVAKREAALVRANATREAANILEAARAQAEAYRRDAEQADSGWTRPVDQQVPLHVNVADNRDRTPGLDRQRGE
jgi:cell division septum initiation protein DivIVA